MSWPTRTGKTRAEPVLWPRARITRSQRVLLSSYVWKIFDTDRPETCLCACLAGLALLPTNPVSLAMFLDVYEGSLSFAWAALPRRGRRDRSLTFRATYMNEKEHLACGMCAGVRYQDDFTE